MSAPKGADITDAETRSALVLLLETRVYYGFIRGRKKEYVHFNLLYVQSLTRDPEPCA